MLPGTLRLNTVQSANEPRLPRPMHTLTIGHAEELGPEFLRLFTDNCNPECCRALERALADNAELSIEQLT